MIFVTQRYPLDGDTRSFGDENEVLIGFHLSMQNAEAKANKSALNRLTASPCTIIVRSDFSITFGSAAKADGGESSPPSSPTNTSISEHANHETLTGAWIARFTSSRSKYTGDCFWKVAALAMEPCE